MDCTINICVLNWNGGDDLLACINSIENNDSNDYKITVIDNNSSDNSIDKLPNTVKVVKLNKNFGFGVGYNKGISKSFNSDDSLVLLNPDTIVAPDFVESIINTIKEKGKQHIYGAKILFHHKPDIIWYGGGVLDLTAGIISHRLLRTRNNSKVERKPTDFVTGCCLIIHNEIFSQLGGFDPRFFMYNEDVDLCLRAKEIGVSCIYDSRIKVFHKVSLSLGGNYSIKKIVKKSISTWLLYNKYYPVYKSLPLFCLYLLKTILGVRYE